MIPERKRSSSQVNPRSRSSMYWKRLYQRGEGGEPRRQGGLDDKGWHARVGFDPETVFDPFRPAAEEIVFVCEFVMTPEVARKGFRRRMPPCGHRSRS